MALRLARFGLGAALCAKALTAIGFGLPLLGSAVAAPTVKAKTELVPFVAAPFPYDGRPIPGSEKPFFDVEKDGRRGHTSPRGGVYWEDATYSDPRVLLHIPKGFDPRRPAVMVVYFHGNQATLERDVVARQQVPRQVALSGLNALLVAPQFAVNALDSTAGHFYEAGAFRRFVEEACARLARLHGGDRRARAAIEALPVVLVAYSGGYIPAAWAVHHGGIGDRLRGIVMLDSLYGEFEKYATWIASNHGGFFFSAHSRSAREDNAAMQRLLTERGIDFATALPARLGPGTVAFQGTADEIVHADFVTRAWVDDPLAEILRRIPGFTRSAPPAGKRTVD
jgi:hypothetical protein